MTSTALLPPGLMDVLPPDAAFEAATVERLLATFAGFGYERVKPPLIEFEDTFLAGSGAVLAEDTFRLMDPVSQRMLALRPDMTMQVARIAAVRLAHRDRPLRLAYAGQVVRVRGTQLRPERQFGQVGAELVGSASVLADVEVIEMAATAMEEVGLTGISVDLGIPVLLKALLADRALDAATKGALMIALDRKDETAIRNLAPRIGSELAQLLARLVSTTGPAEAGIATLSSLTLSAAAGMQRQRLVDVYEGLRRAMPSLAITVDVLEQRGFEYHSGVTFSLFAKGFPGELGRGGRYRTDSEEDATGVTIFMDGVLRTLPAAALPGRVFVPAGIDVAVGRRLRAEGWVTLSGLDAREDVLAEAARLGCSHVIEGDRLQALAGTANAVGEEA